MGIFWKKSVVDIVVDITGKEIGDSVKSPLSFSECEKIGNSDLLALKIKLNDDIIAVTTNYYKQDSDGIGQYVFLTGLPAIEDVQFTALILSDNEFTIVGVDA